MCTLCIYSMYIYILGNKKSLSQYRGYLVYFHQDKKLKATLTAVQPPGKYGLLDFERGRVLGFKEKPKGDGNWVNGGFFVLNTSIFDLLDGDDCVWEQNPLNTLAETGQLSAYNHPGFWHPMDTLRDKNYLEELWASDNPPWKIWDN